jgi:hypothetical protein
VIFEPEDFIARLAALVPKPRAHLTRYHGVFAPASPDRAQIVPSARAVAERSEAAAIDRHQGMSWAQRLKRVFAIDIEICRRCGGRLRVIASIEEPAVIERILKHLARETWASANQGLSWPGLAMFRGSFYFASLAFNSSGQDEQKHSFKPLLYLSHRHRRGTSYFAHNSVYGNKFIFEKLNINFCNIYTYRF